MKRMIAILIVGGAGCSSVSTSTDYDPNADFSRLRTFEWFPGQPSGPDSLTASRIARAVEDGLRARGYARATAGPPDFQVAYHVSIGRRVEAVPGSAYSYGWRSGYNTSTEIRAYDEGTLVLDVIDPTAKTLLWRGTARSAVEPDRTPEEREAKNGRTPRTAVPGPLGRCRRPGPGRRAPPHRPRGRS